MGKSRRRQLRWQQEGFGTNPLCYLCATSPATSDDHVPPEGFFPKGQPKGYRLPACEPCNRGYSKDDDYARDFIAQGGLNQDAYQVFKDKIQPSYQRPYSWLQPVTKLDRLTRNIKVTEIFTPGGLYLGQRPTTNAKRDRINHVLERITRGLYYQHAKRPIPPVYSVEAYFQPKEFLTDTLVNTPGMGAVFGKVFAYKGVISASDMVSGFWWMTFYESQAVLCSVIKSSDLQKIRDGQDLLKNLPQHKTDEINDLYDKYIEENPDSDVSILEFAIEKLKAEITTRSESDS
jgi:hypothetical protein